MLIWFLVIDFFLLFLFQSDWSFVLYFCDTCFVVEKTKCYWKTFYLYRIYALYIFVILSDYAYDLETDIKECYILIVDWTFTVHLHLASFNYSYISCSIPFLFALVALRSIQLSLWVEWEEDSKKQMKGLTKICMNLRDLYGINSTKVKLTPWWFSRTLESNHNVNRAEWLCENRSSVGCLYLLKHLPHSQTLNGTISYLVWSPECFCN